jgi:hypothetical protein
MIEKFQGIPVPGHDLGQEATQAIADRLILTHAGILPGQHGIHGFLPQDAFSGPLPAA